MSISERVSAQNVYKGEETLHEKHFDKCPCCEGPMQRELKGRNTIYHCLEDSHCGIIIIVPYC